MTRVKASLFKMGNSHALIIPLAFLKAMKIKKPLKARFEILTDGVSLLLRRVKK